MASVHGPKLIAGNSNLKLARSMARRMSLHRGMNVDLVENNGQEDANAPNAVSEHVSNALHPAKLAHAYLNGVKHMENALTADIMERYIMLPRPFQHLLRA